MRDSFNVLQLIDSPNENGKEYPTMLLSRAHQNEVYGKSEGESGLIREIADMLCQGRSKDAIRARCVAAGQDDSQAYLTYMAASILAGDRVGARRSKVA